MQLSNDQQKVMTAIQALIADPTQQCLVVSGPAGAGKTFCMQELARTFDKYQNAIKKLNPSHIMLNLIFTATTNKAVEALELSVGEAQTIHRLLGLGMTKDQNGKDVLYRRSNQKLSNKLVVIDEASYMDEELMDYLENSTEKCKFIFVGDAQQLTPVNLDYTPAFDIGLPVVELKQILRQANGNPIQKLSSDLREYVAGSSLPAIKPDGVHILHLSKKDMFAHMLQEFGKPGFNYYDAKFIAWRNKTVIEMGKSLSAVLKNSPNFKKGDYATCNSYFKKGKTSLRTDSLVHISEIYGECEKFGMRGQSLLINNTLKVFMPYEYQKVDALKKAYWTNGDHRTHQQIEESFIDLRSVYSCTVHKSQGSTFDTVYLDMDDILTCPDQDDLARMLYVAISRARTRLVITGTIP